MCLTHLCPISWTAMYVERSPADGYGRPSSLVVPNSVITQACFFMHTPPTGAKPNTGKKELANHAIKIHAYHI